MDPTAFTADFAAIQRVLGQESGGMEDGEEELLPSGGEEFNEDLLDMGYIEQCTSKRLIRQIVGYLEKEPYYPQLTKRAGERLRELDPDNLRFKVSDPSQALKQLASADLADFASSIALKDFQLKQAQSSSSGGGTTAAPIRGSAEHVQRKQAADAAQKKGMKIKYATHMDDDQHAHLPAEERAARAQSEKRKGNEAFKARDFKEAIAFYKRAIDYTPQDAVLYSNSAMANLKLERYEKAEKDCTAAIERDGGQWKAFWRRGKAHQGRLHHARALEDFDAALERVPADNSKVRANIEKDRARSDDQLTEQKLAGSSGGYSRVVVEEESDSEPEQQEQQDPVAVTLQPVMKRMAIIEDDDDSSDESDDEDGQQQGVRATTTTSPSAAAAAAAATAAAALKPKAETKVAVADIVFDDIDDRNFALDAMHEQAPFHCSAPRPAEDAKAEGNKMFKKKLFSEAIRRYSQALEHLAEASAELGGGMGTYGAFGYHACIYLSNRASAYDHSENFDACIADLTEALALQSPPDELKPNFRPKLFMKRGKAFIHKNDAASALRDMKRVYRLDPEFPAVQTNLVYLETQMRRRRKKKQQQDKQPIEVSNDLAF